MIEIDNMEHETRLDEVHQAEVIQSLQLQVLVAEMSD
jgi:hypothetical protein